MNIEEKFYLIDRELLGQLTKKEELIFSESMKDSAFKAEYELRYALSEAAKIEGRKALKDQFNKLEQGKEPGPKVLSLRNFASIAAIGAILIVAYFLLKPSSKQGLDYTEVYASHYSKLENKIVPIQRGDSLDELDSMKMAFIAYNQSNYDETLHLFDILEKNHPEVDIYRGIIAMEAEDYPTALEVFSEIEKKGTHRFLEDAMWYRALCNLKQNQISEAQEVFTKMAEKDTYYGKKAEDVLMDLGL